MINDDAKSLYQNIKAPDELKKRVMDMYDEKNSQKKNIFHYNKYLSLAAACFVLILGVSAFFGVNKISVSVNDDFISSNFVSKDNQSPMLAFERSDLEPKTVFAINVKSNIDTDIWVTEGHLSLFDQETGEMLSEGNQLSFKGNVVAVWNITSIESNCEMKIKNFISTKTLNAEYDTSNNSFQLQ